MIGPLGYCGSYRRIFGEGERRMASDADKSCEQTARRAFLRHCATYAAGMPPAITLLLSADDAKADPVKKCSEFCADPSPPQPPSCECNTPLPATSGDSSSLLFPTTDPELNDTGG